MFLVCPMRHPAVLVHVDAAHEIIPMDDEVRNSISLLIIFYLSIYIPNLC